MPLYRKKPVVIEARRMPSDSLLNAPVEVSLAQWCGGKMVYNGILIPTLEGDHLARPGDWIIKGVNGEFYPCKPDIFEKTYELDKGE
jgi:hypothetical protein